MTIQQQRQPSKDDRYLVEHRVTVGHPDGMDDRPLCQCAECAEFDMWFTGASYEKFVTTHPPDGRLFEKIARRDSGEHRQTVGTRPRSAIGTWKNPGCIIQHVHRGAAVVGTGVPKGE